jgi:hypothetical protein
MFCAPGFVFGGTEGAGSRFHELRSRTPFRRYRGHWVQFFLCCAPGLVFGGAEGVGSLFQVLSSRTRFQQYRVRRGPVFMFCKPDSFSTVLRASGPVFMFCKPRLIFDGTEGVGSRFHVFALPDPFSAVPRASSPFSTFFTLGIVFGGAECVGSLFHVLPSRTHFRRYRGRRVSFSCFARPDPFSAIPRASVPVFMFCAPGLHFGGTDGVGSCFHMLCSRTLFRRCRGRQVLFSCFALPDSFSAVSRASGPVLMFCAPELFFGCTEGVGSPFHVLRSRTRFLRYRRRRVPFSFFALPDSFSAVLRVSGPVLMFCAPGLIFGCNEGVGSRFNVLCSRCFHVLRSRTRFRRCRVRRVPFSCFALPDSCSAVPRALGPIFKFCASGPILHGTEDVVSRFHVLRSRIRFRRYRGRWVPFTCFALPDSFSAVPRALGPVFFMLCSRTRFRRCRGHRVPF